MEDRVVIGVAACPIRQNDNPRPDLTQGTNNFHAVFICIFHASIGNVERLSPSYSQNLCRSAASAARSSAEPRVPASPCVRSRIAVRQPSAFILSSVPPHVCSTSSRCAAMARISAMELSVMFLVRRSETGQEAAAESPPAFVSPMQSWKKCTWKVIIFCRGESPQT